ncbi:MAG: metallophosphoesterase [Rhodobacteraceae bacterium]|nr:metallophosphoesterase [Paracoccaceae bacterium]
MSALVRRLFTRRRPPAPAPQPAVSGMMLDPPLPTIYAVGDVHGRLDLYRAMEARIAADAVPGAKLIVLLGDIIDRGPDSAGMIDHLLAPAPMGTTRLCLLGNHEDMALQFLRDPDPRADWLAYGGAEMLASYGIARDITALHALSPKALAMRIAAHIPQEHVDFLAGLPLYLHAGRHYLCHAGVDPAQPLDQQDRQTLLWSRRFADPESLPPPDLAPGGLVVQGHMPVTAPSQRDWRINVDTGAYVTGRLSAVRLVQGLAPVFLAAGD